VKRFVAICAALLALVLASTGCNSLSTTAGAAQVGGSIIATSELNASMQQLRSDTGFLCASGGGTLPVTTGAGTDTWSTSYADSVLTQLIKFRILDQMVAARHVALPAADFSLAQTETEEGISQTLTTLQQEGVTCPNATAASIVSGLGSSFRSAFVDNQLNQDAYSAYLAGTSLQPAALSDWENAHRAEATLSCSAVIGVATKKLALSIATAVKNGASFASEATKHSENIGAGTGGSIGCLLPSSWPGTLGPVAVSVKLDTASRPVELQKTWILIYVTSRALEPLSDVVSQLVGLEATAFDAQYSKAVASADISVSSVYGTLQRKVVQGVASLSVVVPGSSACKYALAPSAAGCPATTHSVATGATGSG
jgi:hypothetical protein